MGSGTRHEQRVVAAITKVAAAVVVNRRQRERGAAGSVQRIATVVRKRRQAAEDEHRRVVAAGLLEPIDPLDVGWDVFAAMSRERKEVSWTQWLANLLRPNAQCDWTARLAWRALCGLVAQRVGPQHLTVEATRDVLATASAWRAASSLALDRDQVLDEHKTTLSGDDEDPRGGIPDITVDTPDLYAIIEIKILQGTWNTGQPEFYRKIGLHHRRHQQRLGLVSLASHRLHSRGDFVCLTWAEYAQALRHELRATPGVATSVVRWTEAVPILATIRGIEASLMDLRGGSSFPPPVSPSRRRVLQAIAHHLDGTK